MPAPSPASVVRCGGRPHRLTHAATTATPPRAARQLGIFASTEFFAAAGEWYYFVVLGIAGALVYFGFTAYEQAKVARISNMQRKLEEELLKSE